MAKTDYNDYWKSLEIAIAKHPSESNDAYQAFLCFVALRGKQRCLETVAEATGYALSTLKQYQMFYKWLDRADAVDAQVWIREQQDREQIIRKDNEKFAIENAAIKKDVLRIGRKMLKSAENLLQNVEVSGKVIETGHVETKDGRRVATHTTIEMKAKVSDIPRLVDTAVKVTRLANDLPTEIVDLPQLPKAGEIGKLSIEQLQQMREDNRQVLVKKGVDVQDLENIG